jgi:DNA-binding beta-propeller fold protein YncE
MNNIDNLNGGRLVVLDAKNCSILSFDTNGNDMRIVVKKCAGFPDGIAVDPIRQHIYWTNMGEHPQGEHFYQNDGSIERADFDGSNQITIVPKGGTFTPKQLTLDTKNGFIYWSDREGMRVMRARLDGSDITTLVQTGQGEEDRKDETRHCVGIAIDVEHGYLYWTQKGPANGGKGRIFRAGLDLPPQVDPALRKDVELLWEDLPEPIDLEIDPVNGNLYWTDRGDGPGGNTLNRADIYRHHGREREVLVSGLKEGIGLTVDPPNDVIYFTDLMGHIYSSTLEGFHRRNLYSGDRFFTGIAYVPHSISSELRN